MILYGIWFNDKMQIVKHLPISDQIHGREPDCYMNKEQVQDYMVKLVKSKMKYKWDYEQV